MGLYEGADWDILDEPLARAVQTSLSKALQAGVVFSAPPDPLSLFRKAVADAITSVEERGDLLKRFLELGPFEGEGPIPERLRGQRLPDAEVERAIAFVYCHVVNSFKGALAELLAVGEVVELLDTFQREGVLREPITVFAGDSMWLQGRRGGWKKGADMHILALNPRGGSRYEQVGVVEVKSYRLSRNRLVGQMRRHVDRSSGGARIQATGRAPKEITLRVAEPQILVGVLPSGWKLPREFWYEEESGKRRLCAATVEQPAVQPAPQQLGPHEWRLDLPWSQEAIASSGFALTFWYMGQLGAELYSGTLPKGWEEMSPEESGQNAAKMMLYCAILRCKKPRASQRAIGLYNSYGFGYSLGMNFVDSEGRRDMLWPEDLDEILANGHTRHGCTIR